MRDIKELFTGIGFLLVGIFAVLLGPRACSEERMLKQYIESNKTFIIDSTEYKCAITNKLQAGKE